MSQSNAFTVAITTQSTLLAQACAALSSGQSASFASGTGHGLSSAQLDWQARFFHDAARGLVWLMGKAANDNNDWRLRCYDIAGNAWSSHDYNFSRAGHIYAEPCLDPATGDLYIAPGTSDTRDLWRRDYASGTWSQVTTQLAAGSVTNGPHACVWHPNLYGAGVGGVVTCTQTSGANNSLCYYRASNGAVERTYLGASVGGTTPQGVYFAAMDKAIVGRTTHYTVAPNGGSTPISASVGAPPLQTMGSSSGTNHAVMLPHPGNSAKLLMLEKLGTSRYWESTDGDTWTEAGTHPFSNAPNDPITLCSLDDGLGCVWAIGEYGGSLTSVLWRPAA